MQHLQERVREKCGLLPEKFTSIDDWQAFRADMLEHLRKILPVWEIPSGLDHIVRGRNKLGDSLIHESVDVNFEKGFYIPVHVYSREAGQSRNPAVIVCHGFSSSKRTQHIVDLCISLADGGFTALAMEYDGSGERAERPDMETDINNTAALGQLLGITNVGLRVMNNMAALDYLKKRGDIDERRIGITGLCQGAIVTWFTAAVCEEFAAVAPVCGATTYETIALEYCNRQGGWSGISPYVFNLLELADVNQVIAACAPRPLFVQNNLTDIHWPLSGFYKVKSTVENVYNLYSAGEKCSFLLENSPHAYAGRFLENTVRWFKNVL